MDAQAPMPKRLRIIFRVLAALTLLEGLVGLYAVAFSISIVPLTLESMKYMHDFNIHSISPVFFMAAVNLALDVMLFVAGTLIWRLQRRGLFLLVCTLLAEMVYFLGALILSFDLDRPHSGSFALLVASGNLAIGLQMFTAFPIVAGVLLFFAYRYLGIPARPLK